jgi:hypothetical protein
VSGFVGIGTSNPTAGKLEISNGGGTNQGWSGNDLTFYNANGTSALTNNSGNAWWYTNGSQAIWLRPGGTSAGLWAASTGTITVGTNTTSPSTLGVDGGVAIGTTYYNTNTAASNNLIVQGTVAIGTPTTSSTFEVNGSAKVDTTLAVTGIETLTVAPTVSAWTTAGVIENNTSGVLSSNATVSGALGGTGVSNSGKTITIGGNVTFSGAYATTFTIPGANTYTFPAATQSLAGLATNQSWTAGQAVTPTAGGTQSAGGTYTPNFSSSNSVTLTFGTGNLTIANPTNIKAGQAYQIALTQDSVGGRTVSWGTYFTWSAGSAPVLSTPANSVDVISCWASSTTVLECVPALIATPAAAAGSFTTLSLTGAVTFPAARVGTFVCTAAGTITITNSNMAATSNVIISMNVQGGTITTPPAMKTVTPGTGFSVLCGATDTSTYNYVILN